MKGVRGTERLHELPGYSGTPLGKKLGLKPGMRVILLNPPSGYEALVAPVPPGVTFRRRLSAGIDMVHIFATGKRRLSEALRAVLPKLKPDGMIWVSWPKRSAGLATDITEDTVREIALPLGLVESRSARWTRSGPVSSW